MLHKISGQYSVGIYFSECKQTGKPYAPFRFPNGDTRPELLIRSRYLLFKSADKWTERQKERAKILFEEYPDIKYKSADF